MADLVKRDPFRNLFPRWMDDFDFSSSSQRGLRVHETNDSIIVEAVVAGVPSDNVDINIEDGVVTIRAEKTEEEGNGTGLSKQSYSYYYSVALSGGKWDKAEAEVEDGVLFVTIPKQEEVKPRSIKVKTKKSK